MSSGRSRARASATRVSIGACCLALVACGGGGEQPLPDAGPSGAAGAPDGDAPDPPPDPNLPYASELVNFEPGVGAGYGQNKLPNVVLGPPAGGGTDHGSLDVLSLGKGGSIVLGFELLAIADGPGPDFVVFENPFWPGGDASRVYAEPGEVSVSEDGETWLPFPCDAAGDGAGHFAGCAGVTPTLAYDPESQLPLDPAVTGGDAFDLADLGVTTANFVKIRDVSNHGDAPTAGFDLDAIGVVNLRARDAGP